MFAIHYRKRRLHKFVIPCMHISSLLIQRMPTIKGLAHESATRPGKKYIFPANFFQQHTLFGVSRAAVVDMTALNNRLRSSAIPSNFTVCSVCVRTLLTYRSVRERGGQDKRQRRQEQQAHVRDCACGVEFLLLMVNASEEKAAAQHQQHVGEDGPQQRRLMLSVVVTRYPFLS